MDAPIAFNSLALGGLPARHARYRPNHTAMVVTSRTQDDDIRLTWSELDPAFLVEFDAERSATGAHEMISLFVPARRADVVVNGIRSTGAPEPRDLAGKQSSTAFLAFSETWLKVNR